MGLTEGLISGAWWWLSLLVSAASIALAMRFAPWSALIRYRPLQHLLFGGIVFILLLCQMRAGLVPGIEIRLLGVTLLTLVFGWELAILAGMLGVIGLVLTGNGSWHGLPVSGLCYVVVPIAISQGIYRLVYRRLPHNLFIYLLVSGYFGAAFAACGSVLAMALILWTHGVYDGDRLVGEFLIYLPLIMLSEAVVNGIVLTGLVVEHPHLVRTFDPGVYYHD